MASRLQDVILRGTAAARPASTAVAPGTLYYSTDSSVTERCADDGASWEDYSDGGTGGGGGNSTSTGADASKPGSPTAGDLFLPNDGFFVDRSTGSAWVPWGPLFPMTDPTLPTWAWVNQASATVDTSHGGIFLATPSEAASSNLHARVTAAPATPYTITMAVLPHLLPVDYQQLALIVRQSSDGKIAAMSWGSNSGAKITIDKYSSATAFAANYLTLLSAIPTGLLFLRVTDNGTNRIFSVSWNGQHFLQLHSVSRTDYLTADQVGFAVQSANTTWPAGMTVLSWKVT